MRTPRYARPRNYCGLHTHAHSFTSLYSALAPGEEAFQGMQKAEEGRFGSRDGGIQGRGGRRR